MTGSQRPVRRVRAGLYRTEDERYEIGYEEWWLDGECECAVCASGASYGCRNGGAAKRSGWTVFDTLENVHVIGEPFAFDTYRDALAYLVENVLAA